MPGNARARLSAAMLLVTCMATSVSADTVAGLSGASLPSSSVLVANVNEDVERKQIIRQIRKLRQALENKDALAIESIYGSELVAAGVGKVFNSTRENIVKGLEASGKIFDYRIVPLDKPVIELDPGGRIAWALTNEKKFVTESASGRTAEIYESSSLMVFRKDEQGTWRLVSYAETRNQLR